jgi:hypothetical protein
MDLSIQAVRDYTCIVIKVFFVFLCIIQNIRLIPCMYFFNLKRKVKKTTHMLSLWYVRPILLKRSPHLSRTILSLNWEKQSIVFQVMMMIGKCLRVGTYQYSPILDDPYQKMLSLSLFLSFSSLIFLFTTRAEIKHLLFFLS